MDTAFAFGLGLTTADQNGNFIDFWYPVLLTCRSEADSALMQEVLTLLQPEVKADCTQNGISPSQLAELAKVFARHGAHKQAEIIAKTTLINSTTVAVFLFRDTAIIGTSDAYLKLHLLSSRLALPNSLNLTGIFAALPTIAHTSEGPCAVEQLMEKRLVARKESRTLTVHSIDKFPRMTDYIVPTGVRIADASRIRLGAYLGPGVTVMHEGFANFNAGAKGPAMIEGRLSQGVFMAENSDLGGGASTMGTLSGGGDTVLSIGRNCLVSANSGIGISLGDRCIVEAGLYVTAGMPIAVLDADRKLINTVKARDLSGKSDILFIRNATNGRVEARVNIRAIDLNPDLHATD